MHLNRWQVVSPLGSCVTRQFRIVSMDHARISCAEVSMKINVFMHFSDKRPKKTKLENNKAESL